MHSVTDTVATAPGLPSMADLAQRATDDAGICPMMPLSLERLQGTVLFAARLRKFLLVSWAYLGVQPSTKRLRLRPINRPQARNPRLDDMTRTLAWPRGSVVAALLAAPSAMPSCG